MQPLLTSSQVADLLHCERSTVEEMLRRGALPGVRFGRSWVIPSEALMQFLNQAALAQAAERKIAASPVAVARAVGASGRRKREPPVLPSL
jgi:excisionase family DNA binding protein